MTKYYLIIGLAIGLTACDGESEDTNLTDDVEVEATEDTDDAVEGEMIEDEGYTLGPIPEEPLLNMYGEDSLDADGNMVYPPRDTIYDN